MIDQPHFQKPELAAAELQGPDEAFTTLDDNPSTVTAAAAGEPKSPELTEQESPSTNRSPTKEEDQETEMAVPKAAGRIVATEVTLEQEPELPSGPEPPVTEITAEVSDQNSSLPDEPNPNSGEGETSLPPLPDESTAPSAAAPPGDGKPPRRPEHGGDEEDEHPSGDSSNEKNLRTDEDRGEVVVETVTPRHASAYLNEFSAEATKAALPEAKRMLTDDDELSDEDTYAAALVVGQSAIRDKMAERSEEARALIEVFREAPPEKEGQLISILYQVSRRDNIEADQLLREKLSANMGAVQAEIDRAKINDPDNEYPEPETDRLNTIINVCEQNGIPPNAWIDDFSPSAEYRWIQYARHYIRTYQPGALDADMIAGDENIGRVVDELINTDHFPGSFAVAVTPELLRTLPSTELREQVLTNFFEAAAQQPLTPSGLRTYFSVAAQVALQPELASTERLSTLAKRLDSYKKEMSKRGVSDYELKLAANPWELARTHLNSSPQEVMQFMDSYIAEELHARDAPTGRQLDDVLNQNLIPARDKSFLTLSHLHRTAGDFTGALAYLGGISDSTMLEKEYRGLFAAVSERSQLESLRPDPLTMSSHPSLERHYNASLALLGDNLHTLDEVGREIAKDYRAVDTTVDGYYLKQIISHIAPANPALALSLTRFTVEKLTEKVVPLADVLPFWAILLKANQIGEVPKVLQAINRGTRRHPVRKAAQLMRLNMEIGNAPLISG